MRTIRAAVSDIAGRPGMRVVLLFFYSGHSDGLNLEMGEERVPFSEIKEWLRTSDATVKIAIVDACHSGGFSEIKGGFPGPAFDIVVDGNLSSTGMAIITSSSSAEKSQESDEILGSYFTHYFVSGLYGAADSDRDRRVTLQEVYKYSYGNTVGRTLATTVGPQHPTYQYALEGKGDLVLSMVTEGAGTILFAPALSGDFFLFEAGGGDLLAELSKAAGQPQHLMVAAGQYLVARRRNGALAGTEVTVKASQSVTVDEAQLTTRAIEVAWPRGGHEEPATAVATFYSLSGWLMQDMGPVHGAGFSLTRRIGPVTSILGFSYGTTTVNDAGLLYQMDVMSIEVTPMWRFELPAADLLVGLVAGSRILLQDAGVGGEYSAGTFMTGAIGGIDVTVLEPVSVLVTWEMDADLFGLNEGATVAFSPRAKLAVAYWF
jgi:hypothetical protein